MSSSDHNALTLHRHTTQRDNRTERSKLTDMFTFTKDQTELGVVDIVKPGPRLDNEQADTIRDQAVLDRRQPRDGRL